MEMILLIGLDAASYILTLYEKRVAPEDLPFFLSLMDHLAARGDLKVGDEFIHESTDRFLGNLERRRPLRPQDNTDMGSRYRKWMIAVYVARALNEAVLDDA